MKISTSQNLKMSQFIWFFDILQYRTLVEFMNETKLFSSPS